MLLIAKRVVLALLASATLPFVALAQPADTGADDEPDEAVVAPAARRTLSTEREQELRQKLTAAGSGQERWLDCPANCPACPSPASRCPTKARGWMIRCSRSTTSSACA